MTLTKSLIRVTIIMFSFVALMSLSLGVTAQSKPKWVAQIFFGGIPLRQTHSQRSPPPPPKEEKEATLEMTVFL